MTEAGKKLRDVPPAAYVAVVKRQFGLQVNHRCCRYIRVGAYNHAADVKVEKKRASVLAKVISEVKTMVNG